MQLKIHHKQYRYPWFPEGTEMIPRGEALEYITQDNIIPFGPKGEMKAIHRLEFEIQRGKVAIRNSQVLDLSSVISCKLSFYAGDPYFKITTRVLAKGNRPTVATFFKAGCQRDLYMIKLTGLCVHYPAWLKTEKSIYMVVMTLRQSEEILPKVFDQIQLLPLPASLWNDSLAEESSM